MMCVLCPSLLKLNQVPAVSEDKSLEVVSSCME